MRLQRNTRLICTLSDRRPPDRDVFDEDVDSADDGSDPLSQVGSSESFPYIDSLYNAGMDVARINLSHGTRAQHSACIEAVNRIRSVRGKEGELPCVSLGLMLDTRGPEVRVETFRHQAVVFRKGDCIRLVGCAPSSPQEVRCAPVEVLNKLQKGDAVFFQDGLLVGSVIQMEQEPSDTGSNQGRTCVIRVHKGSTLYSNKGMNVPSRPLGLPLLTQQDQEDLLWGGSQGMDIVALSFTRTGEDVCVMRRFLDEAGLTHVLIISKIESKESLCHLDSIVEESDGIMLARGDLGVEIEAEKIPFFQKRIASLCRSRHKPFIVATEIMESMIHNPRPTRAEVSDVANAIYDGANALMLSAETAIGEYPAAVVRMTGQIVSTTEKTLSSLSIPFLPPPFTSCDFHSLKDDTQTVTKGDETPSPPCTQASCNEAHATILSASIRGGVQQGAKALFLYVEDTDSMRTVFEHYFGAPILVWTPSPRVQTQCAIGCGVTCFLGERCDSLETWRTKVMNLVEQGKFRGILEEGDVVLVLGLWPSVSQISTLGTLQLLRV